MTFAVEIKYLPKSEVEIAGEVPAADFDRAVLQSLREWNEKAELPGFRAGKIPESLLIETIGMSAILERAAEIALTAAYPKILDDNKLDAIGQPKISITKLARGNALGFKAITAVVPEVKLPDWRAIASATTPKKAVVIEEKEITDALEYLRSAHASKNAAGEEQKPELNDAFAQKLGQKTVDDLKKLLTENILRDKERAANDKKRMEILDAVAAKSAIDLPDVLIGGEKEKMAAELKGSLSDMGLKWDDYLKHIKKTEDELKKDWAPEAEKRARYGLVVKAIADQEKLEPAEADVTMRADELIARYPEADRAKIDRMRVMGYAYGILRNEKVFELLGSERNS